MQIFFKGGTQTEPVEIEYPIGHRRRREEGVPVMRRKFANAVGAVMPERLAELEGLFDDPERLDRMTVSDLVDRLVATSRG